MTELISFLLAARETGASQHDWDPIEFPLNSSEPYCRDVERVLGGPLIDPPRL